MSDDMEHLTLIRENVSKLLGEAIELFDKPEFVVLEVAPQIYDRRFRNCQYHSLDIDPQYDCTYIADITKDNSDIIPSDTYDLIVCTEVLEHTLQPFHAADEMHRMLKPGGVVYGSTPFDLYIHPPLPCAVFCIAGRACAPGAVPAHRSANRPADGLAHRYRRAAE